MPSPEDIALCECGCGNPAPIAKKTRKALGYRKGEPARFILGHNPKRPIEERFWEKVDRGLPDACWPWTAALDHHGYGHLGTGAGGNAQEGAHRVSYRLAKGPIPEGWVVMHICDNPRCVNPAHLRVGTQAENLEDMAAKGRSPSGDDHWSRRQQRREEWPGA